MSDDTPTQRFEKPDTPTEVIGAPSGSASAGTPAAGPPPTGPPLGGGPAAEDGKSRRTLIILLAVGGALLLAVLIALILLLTRGEGPIPAGSPTPTLSSPTPSPTASSSSPTPSSTPIPDPAPTTDPAPPPPPPPGPISAFTASDTTVGCDGAFAVTVTFSWAAVGETLWFGVGTDNAKAEPYAQYPLNYTLDFDYQCGQPSGQQRYTITVEASDGTLKSETIVITEN